MISAVPQNTFSGWDGTAVVLGWESLADKGISAYAVTVFKDSVPEKSVAYTRSNHFSATGFAVTDAAIWTVSVQGIGDSAAGPASLTATLIADTPVISSAGWDGQFAMIRWNALANPVITGYTVTLLENGLPLTSV